MTNTKNLLCVTQLHSLTFTQPFAKFSKALLFSKVLFILILITFCWGGKLKAQDLWINNTSNTNATVAVTCGTACPSGSISQCVMYVNCPANQTIQILASNLCYSDVLKADFTNSGSSDGSVVNDLDCNLGAGVSCGNSYPAPPANPNSNQSYVVYPGLSIYFAQGTSGNQCSQNIFPIPSSATSTDYVITLGY